MRNLDATDTEHERILRGEANYADEEWVCCPACGGSGEGRDEKNCPHCRGRGEVPIKGGEDDL